MGKALVLLCGGAALFLGGLVLPFVPRRPQRGRNDAQVTPEALERSASIEMVIPAYLEAGVIANTIQNLRRQLKAWPGPASVTVVASDAATADAAALADKVLFVGRSGKPAACNIGVRESTADVIVFSDANCTIDPDEWPLLVRDHLSSLSLVSANKAELGGSDSMFWAYESKVKRSTQAKTGSLAVVGEFMAFRRSDYRPVPEETQLDDFWMALDFNRRNLGVGLATNIHTIEEASTAQDQWERRVRITAGVLYEAIPNIPWLLRTGAGQKYLAHKLYRTTLGTLGFWTSVGGFMLLFPPVTVPLATVAVAWSVAVYAGRTNVGARLKPVTAVVAMQVVVLVSTGRAVLRAMRTKSPHSRKVGWTKIER